MIPSTERFEKKQFGTTYSTKRTVSEQNITKLHSPPTPFKFPENVKSIELYNRYIHNFIVV